MKIERRRELKGRVSALHDALDEILQSDRSDVPVCAPNCPKAGPACSRLCADIPRMLSSDPVNHPLEGRIAPLVYELKRLEAFSPCWSCEGHNGHDGTLWKKPRVWFYCDSVVQLRVLAAATKELHLAKKLSVPWRVTLTFSDDKNADTTFSLEPVLELDCPSLFTLQNDIDVIAESLRDNVFLEVHKLIRSANNGD